MRTGTAATRETVSQAWSPVLTAAGVEGGAATLGPLLGAAAGEFLALRDALRAGKVGLGAFVGFIVGTAAKIGCAAAILLTLLGMWLYSLF